SWGFENGHLEPWDFGHDGWTNEHVTAHIVSPVKDALVIEVVAWTPSTAGTVTAHAFHLAIPERPTSSDLNAYLEGVGASVKGQTVRASRSRPVPVTLTPRPTRQEETRLRERYENPGQPAAAATGATPSPGASATTPPPMTNAQINQRIDEF